MLGAIVAMTHDRVIGRDGTIPWTHKGDLRLFKEKTTGQSVIMGRKTWESLPDLYRPLPGRQNIVLSRDPAFAVRTRDYYNHTDIKNYIAIATSPAAALQACDREHVWVVGGADVYEAFMPQLDCLLVTFVPDRIERGPGVVLFPNLTWNDPGEGDGGLEFVSEGPHPYNPDLILLELARR